MVKKQMTIISEVGLHARPASILVNKAGTYQADVEIQSQGNTVNAKSILGLMSLGATQGQAITIICQGEDEAEAIESITQLLIHEGIAE